MSTIYQFDVVNNRGETIKLSEYENKVILIVNTASACGFTPQYEGLQKMYSELQDQGFVVLAFPCNQFKNQEQGDNEEIKNFCDLQFNIKFPLFCKIDVNGKHESPLFTYLKNEAPGILGSKSIKWNFTKFLINKQGKVMQRYAPFTKPESIKADIIRLLAE